MFHCELTTVLQISMLLTSVTLMFLPPSTKKMTYHWAFGQGLSIISYPWQTRTLNNMRVLMIVSPSSVEIIMQNIIANHASNKDNDGNDGEPEEIYPSSTVSEVLKVAETLKICLFELTFMISNKNCPKTKSNYISNYIFVYVHRM